MHKSEVIATCLVNSNFANNIKSGEVNIQNIFHDEFPNHNFHDWNTNIPDKTAENIIKNVGRASKIDVKSFIDKLWG